ncbi:MAG: DUF5666 domain-containing protein [Candidatus Paceibacterota bacterium]|jgi:hypothetical protein
MYNKKYLTLLVITGFAASLATTAPVLAESDSGNGFGRGFSQERRQSGIFGKVAAVSGTTITITDSKTNKIYTVDASGAKVTKNGATLSISGIIVGDMIMAQGTVTDMSVKATTIRVGVMGHDSQGKGRGIMGTVTADPTGTTFTVAGKTGPGAEGQAEIIYTVDASAATIKINGATSTISNIKSGDTVMIRGTVSSLKIAATYIDDSVPGKGQGKIKNQTPIIQGDGQPMIVGTVSAISSSTITVTNKGNIPYTINISSTTTIKKGGIENATISNIAAGDNIVAQGAVSGTSMTASSIIDQGGAPKTITTDSAGNKTEVHPGLFGDIFNFFKHLFGF